MYKIFFALSLMITSLFSSVEDIDSKIINNKQEYLKVSKKKTNIDKNLKTLASKIKQEKKSYDKIVKVVDKTNSKLALNKLKLTKSIRKLKRLQKQSVKLSKQKKQIEKDVIDFVIERYAMSMGIQQINKESLKDVINKEVYTLVLQNAKQEVLNFNKKYLSINKKIKTNQDTTNSLDKFVKKQEKLQNKYILIKNKQSNLLVSLDKKRQLYKENLNLVIEKQNKFEELFSSLNILKKNELKKSDKKKDTKIVKYKGQKTNAPLKSYFITSKYGKYYDEIYNYELFNEAVSLKTKKPNAKVFSMFNGQIIYVKRNAGLLGNVVIIKHKNDLYTIYSHLDKISPTLEVDKWIVKGYVIGRVSDILQLKATKNSKYIDPLKLFN